MPLSLVSSAVGNDVVDLTAQGARTRHQSEAFVQRICAEGERPRVRTARDLWSLFAAKEAAYKALVKLGPSPGFAYRSLRVSPHFDCVTWGELRLALWLESSAEHVHAVVWSGSVRPFARVVRAGSTAGLRAPAPRGAEAERASKSESMRAREALSGLMADVLGGAPAEYEVVREPHAFAWDGYGPPYLVHHGERVAADVSLSHDERFVAVAALVFDGPAFRLRA